MTYYYDYVEETEDESRYYAYMLEFEEELEQAISNLGYICLEQESDNDVIKQACDRLINIFH